MIRRLVPIALLLVGLPAAAADAREPWPPVKGPGFLFVHYGEEHYNDDDSEFTLPQVVGETRAYRPDLVMMSGDKVDDGTEEQLQGWLQIVRRYDDAGIPFFAAVGNHDRKAPPGALGGTPGEDLTNYMKVYAGRPYPFGDARPYQVPRLSPRTRPATDPAGASSHYFVDYANVRWIFLDNSCYGIFQCDLIGSRGTNRQNPPLPDAEGNRTQYDYLEKRAAEANRDGKLIYLVFHISTRDPRDQLHSSAPQQYHTQTGSPQDDTLLEEAAERAGVDAVFAAHMKGMFQYEGRGGIPYYVDGGAGGELHTTGVVGIDHGYWHGYRVLRLNGTRLVTDAVPIFVKDGITIKGGSALAPGASARFEAFGKQPIFKGHDKVDALELRDPDPVPRGGASSTGGLDLGALPIPAALLALGALLAAFARGRPQPRLAVPALAVTALGGLAVVSVAQQSTPTNTPKEVLPNPARIWTTANPFVLAPVASSSEDPRRDPRTQTQDGAFRARCPGRTRVVIRSGFGSASRPVRVASRPGRVVRSVRLRRRGLRAGRRSVVARVRLAQQAEVLVRVRRRGRTVRTLRRGCFAAGRARAFTWDGRVRRRGRMRRARPGRYRVEVLVRSDRRPLRRARTLLLRRR